MSPTWPGGAVFDPRPCPSDFKRPLPECCHVRLRLWVHHVLQEPTNAQGNPPGPLHCPLVRK